MGDIDLGFPEQRDSAWLTNRYFPSKVGGKPGWLDLSSLPTTEQLRCSKCQQPKAFLCQIYAPFEDEHNFHRSIFVFVCRTESCQVANQADNYTVLRSQLPMHNDFYSETPPPEDGEALPALPTKQKLCMACGCLGPLSCARCHKASYCCATHQRAHWPQHKPNCTADATNPTTTTDTTTTDTPIPEIVFPEYEIVMEPDEQAESAAALDQKDEDDAVKEQQRLADFEKLAAAGQAGDLQDVPDDELAKFAATSESLDDKHFRKFKKVVAKEPQQILRYKRNGTPLWIADMDKTFSATTQQQQLIPPQCESCGGERHFEFQIMPQMLLLLNDDRLDWGVLAIYTCARSCQPPAGVCYVPEFIVKQDIVASA